MSASEAKEERRGTKGGVEVDPTAESDALLEGGCTCGAVRYRMLAEPLTVHCCHCRWCQRETGSAFVLNALIEKECLVQVGTEAVGIETPSASGVGQVIGRCPTCRVAVWSIYGGFDPVRFVRVGTLDDPDRAPPKVHIYTMSRQPWVRLPDGVPAFSEYYEPARIWSEASLARRAVYMERSKRA